MGLHSKNSLSRHGFSLSQEAVFVFQSVRPALECPLNSSAAAESFALSLPAIDVEIIANAAILRQEAIADFEHTARSLEARAGRCVAADARARLAAQFMLPGQPGIALTRAPVLPAVAEAEAQAMRVDVGEVVGIARAAQFHRHTVLVRPEIAHIGVEGSALLQREGLADAEVDAIVGIRAVVSGILAMQAVVALGTACACGGFEPQAVLLRQLAQDTEAKIAELAAAVCAIVEIGIVSAASVFDEGAEESLRAALRRIFTRPANAEIPALGVNVGATLHTHGIGPCTCP